MDSRQQIRVERLRIGVAATTTDPLTGCSNRRQVIAQLGLEAARAARGEPFRVCMADLGHFRSINDRFGHAAGDGVEISA